MSSVGFGSRLIDSSDEISCKEKILGTKTETINYLYMIRFIVRSVAVIKFDLTIIFVRVTNIYIQCTHTYACILTFKCFIYIYLSFWLILLGLCPRPSMSCILVWRAIIKTLLVSLFLFPLKS